MPCIVNYKNSEGLVKAWLLAKYQILYDVFDGISLSRAENQWEICGDIGNPGSSIVISYSHSQEDACYEIMKKAGYFVGNPWRYLGEFSATLTEKALKELRLEAVQLKEEGKRLEDKGYRLFMDRDRLALELRGAKDSAVLFALYGLYLIPEAETKHIAAGTLLVSSVDAREILYDGHLDWKVKDGFSVYGIRPMPIYADQMLLSLDAQSSN